MSNIVQAQEKDYRCDRLSDRQSAWIVLLGTRKFRPLSVLQGKKQQQELLLSVVGHKCSNRTGMLYFH